MYNEITGYSAAVIYARDKFERSAVKADKMSRSLGERDRVFAFDWPNLRPHSHLCPSFIVCEILCGECGVQWTQYGEFIVLLLGLSKNNVAKVFNLNRTPPMCVLPFSWWNSDNDLLDESWRNRVVRKCWMEFVLGDFLMFGWLIDAKCDDGRFLNNQYSFYKPNSNFLKSKLFLE